ncbi:MAG TPA: putative Ig domain-containing protein [Steroidobacteraceae bacterium]|nr:putative Ig domain-containing protein [Steroidobacteraceae bacterium]
MNTTHSIRKRLSHTLLTAALAFALAGCFQEKSDKAEPVDTSGAPTITPSTPSTPSTPPAPAAINHSPDITGDPPLAVDAGTPVSFEPQASDADGDFLEFTITNQPTWAEFSTETGTLTGTPTDADVGETSDITITVTDGRDTRSIGPFKMRINPRNQPPPTNTAPTISGTPAPTVLATQAYLFTPDAADVDGDKLSFSISNRPSWAKFSSSTGTLSGTPTIANVATYSNIVIRVSDGHVTTALPAFSIQVQGPTNNAPVISGSPGTSAQVSQLYSFKPQASDADGDTLKYSISNKPSWASFSTSTGTLSGTPAAANVGNYANIVISVADGRASASLAPFTINVQSSANHAPTIMGSPATSATVGAAYSFQPTASDSDNDTLAFSIQNKPSWASFSSASGALTGTPSGTGTFSNIIISVSDGKTSASLPAFSIAVSGSTNRAPTLSGSPALNVSAGTAYAFQPAASDADGDKLTFSIQNKPTWASFSTSTGALTGLPSTSNVGSYANIRISVSDGSNSVSLPAFTINVIQSGSGSATLSWQPPTQNTDGSALNNLSGFKVAYGTSSSSLTNVVTLANPGLTSYVVTGLGSGTWYFAVTAYNSSGVESSLSNLASKTIP